MRRTSILATSLRQLRVTLRHCLVLSSGLSAYIAVLLFAALYFAVQPTRYVQGLLRLVPSPGRDGAGEMLQLVGVTLRRWIIGQSITMAVVGTLTAIGLALLGVTAPIALGLISGMFAFVPYVGPILASVSGILMASMQGPVLVGYVVALYAGIHFVEGNIITPVVQAEAVELPPGPHSLCNFGLWPFVRPGRRVVGSSARRRPARRGERALHRGDTRRTSYLAVRVRASLETSVR
ncbi:AI-2E family transporter [Bradyrhizobium sp. JR3.5]